MTSTAYSRPSKLPGGGNGSDRRLPPRLMRGLTTKIEPKKLGVGLLAGCCLALLTYVSLAKLFAIYSPVFASTANTSALMQNSPPSSPETGPIPPQETAAGAGNNDSTVDPVDLPEDKSLVEAQPQEPGFPSAESQEPGLPAALSRKEDDAERAAAAAASEIKQCKEILPLSSAPFYLRTFTGRQSKLQ
jgi:hypothetical protein